jgi:hypothetical protein
MKVRCCPNTPIRKTARSIHEPARDVARAVAKTRLYEQSRKDRKTVEMLFAHLKRIMKLDRLRLRGPSGAHDEFLLAATAQNLRRMAKRLCPSPRFASMASALSTGDVHSERLGLSFWPPPTARSLSRQQPSSDESSRTPSRRSRTSAIRRAISRSGPAIPQSRGVPAANPPLPPPARFGDPESYDRSQR